MRHRKDSNQDPIVRALRMIGATVINLTQVGCGCPDLLVCFRGKLTLLEIKTSKGKLSSAQNRLHINLGDCVAVVRDTDEALKAIGATK